MKVAVVVGHNSKAPGASAKSPLSISEFKYYNKIADKMVSLSGGGITCKRFNRVKTGGYGSEIRKVYAQVDAYNPDISIELHFNAAGPTATGTETLSSGSSGSLALSKALQDAQLKHLGLTNRGVKVKSRGDRGGLSLHIGRAPAALIEPFFGSNTKDCKAAHALGIEGMAKMLLEGIRAYAGLEEVAAPVAESVTSSGAFLADAKLKHSGLSKKQFFAQNKAAIKAIVKGVNKTLEAQAHGEPINDLTNIDAFAIMNAEMGLKSNGKVDANHVHSEGEKGLLPLPSNLEFWNGPGSAGLRNIGIDRNVKEFLLYLGNLKNKDIGKDFSGGDLYRDLFTQKGIENSPKKQMAILAAAIHGYFYAGNYTLGLPFGEISKRIVDAGTDHSHLLELLTELGYKHATHRPEIIVNRITNLKEGMGFA